MMMKKKYALVMENGFIRYYFFYKTFGFFTLPMYYAMVYNMWSKNTN